MSKCYDGAFLPVVEPRRNLRQPYFPIPNTPATLVSTELNHRLLRKEHGKSRRS
ncbi:MAG: hypothetical protein J7576_10255 [Siphonobacter aquaeclarae]|nr:hypothetical protein [Siphonobacter aquaeclarae]